MGDHPLVLVQGKVAGDNVRDVRVLLRVPVTGDRDIVVHRGVHAFEFPGDKAERRCDDEFMGPAGNRHLEPAMALRERVRFLCRAGQENGNRCLRGFVPGKKPFGKPADLDPLHRFPGVCPHHTAPCDRGIRFGPGIVRVKVAHDGDVVCVHPAPGFDKLPEF